MNLFQSIIVKIAERFGLQLQDKPLSLDDYTLRPGDAIDSKGNVTNISLTSVIAGKLATLSLQDSDITIEGISARARFMQSFLDYYLGGQMDIAAEVALGTGDCIILPYTDGKRLGVDIIKNSDFVVCESIGNDILSCIMKLGEIKDTQGPTYERLQLQMVRQSDTVGGKTVDSLIIRNMAFRNGKEIPLTEIPAWADIPPEEIIPGVQKPLFGRYKSPAVNRADVNGVGGVKITNGLDGVMSQAVEAYNRFNREYASGEKLTFISKALLDKDGKGNSIYPDGKKNMFMLMKGVGNKDDLLQEHTPDIRSADLEKGIEVNNRMVELLAGLSQGILTPPTTSYATATEMRAALNNTFSVITKFRLQLEKGTNDLLDAVEAIANRNNLSPIGPWTVQYDWSSAYIEQMNEHFTQLTMAEGIGAVDKAEVRAWLMDEDYETAKERVEQIAEESGAEYIGGRNEG